MPAARAMRTKEMNHVVTEPKPGELGRGCKCGQRFPTLKAAELHAADQNLIEENEAKANEAAKAQEAEPTEKANEPTETAKEPEVTVAAPAEPEPPTEKKPDESDSKPEPPATQPAPATDATQALSPSNLPLDLENLSLNQINFIGQTMASPGCSPTSRMAPRRW